MFFLERFLKTLKDFVRLRSQPEASMVEVEWIHNAMTNAKAQGEQISPKEWEYARGCLRKGLIFNSIWSEGRHFRTRKIDERRTTNDCGVMGNFDTTTNEVFYVPCIYQRRLWYVILVTPRGRSIFAEMDIEPVIDPIIPSPQDAEDDVVEVEEGQPSLANSHLEEEEEGESDDDSTGGDGEEEESLNLFIDLNTMGLNMDPSACRDLIQDEN
ncbi:hypothetical protein GOP47_0026361 [Adiantum capillus-veneris]|nr:hypothetical protein GOP47_0026361 [Adiantum capillus-veneris]